MLRAASPMTQRSSAGLIRLLLLVGTVLLLVSWPRSSFYLWQCHTRRTLRTVPRLVQDSSVDVDGDIRQSRQQVCASVRAGDSCYVGAAYL
jgi:hypothetical protein